MEPPIIDPQYPPPAQYPTPSQPPPAEPSDATAPAPAPEWLAPARLPAAVPPPGNGRAAMFELRPLTTGEVLDRTFTLYRSRFWLFAGIAAVSGAVQLVAAASQMVLQHSVLHHQRFGKLDAATFVVIFVANLLFFLAFSVTQAATAFAVSEVYLGRPITILESLRAIIGRWLAYVGIALWQVGSLFWLPALVGLAAGFLFATKKTGLVALGAGLLILAFTGGMALGVIFLLRNLLAVPATVVERLKVRPSMRRSKTLASGAKGRLFVVALITYCLYMVVGLLQAPLAFMMLFAMAKGHDAIAAQVGTLLIGFVGHSAVTPVAMIGITLIYFDQRVRKEAFDIAVLLGDEQAGLPAYSDLARAGAATPAFAPIAFDRVAPVDQLPSANQVMPVDYIAPVDHTAPSDYAAPSDRAGAGQAGDDILA